MLWKVTRALKIFLLYKKWPVLQKSLMLLKLAFDTIVACAMNSGLCYKQCLAYPMNSGLCSKIWPFLEKFYELQLVAFVPNWSIVLQKASCAIKMACASKCDLCHKEFPLKFWMKSNVFYNQWHVLWNMVCIWKLACAKNRIVLKNVACTAKVACATEMTSAKNMACAMKSELHHKNWYVLQNWTMQ